MRVKYNISFLFWVIHPCPWQIHTWSYACFLLKVYVAYTDDIFMTSLTYAVVLFNIWLLWFEQAFFRRTLKKTTVDFNCTCTEQERKLGVDKPRKTSCPKCRYERCIKVGMSKDGRCSYFKMCFHRWCGLWICSWISKVCFSDKYMRHDMLKLYN